MRVRAVCMHVQDLRGPRKHDQHNAQKREEDLQRRAIASPKGYVGHSKVTIT